MKNPADLLELCSLILDYDSDGAVVEEAVYQSAYTLPELLVELARYYWAREAQ